MTTWTPQPTDDGSFTFFSSEFNEAFHSSQGAKAEAFAKFAAATDLAERAKRPNICLLDICYGLGYNSAVGAPGRWASTINRELAAPNPGDFAGTGDEFCLSE